MSKKNWIASAVRSIKKRGTEGKCTPISKPGCTGRAKALAKTFKAMAKKETGGELANGGEIGSGIGNSIGSIANLIVPGLGSLLSPVLGSVGGMLGSKFDNKKQVREQVQASTVNTNPYGFELGGEISGNQDLIFYKGKSHRNGGIQVSATGLPSFNPIAEVEDGETRLKLGKRNYIFSKKLTV